MPMFYEFIVVCKWRFEICRCSSLLDGRHFMITNIQSTVGHNKNPYRTNRFQRYLVEKHGKSSSACAMKYNKIRPTITASKVCNVVKYEIRSNWYCVGQIVKSILILFDIFNIFRVIYKIKIYCSFEVTFAHRFNLSIYKKYFEGVAFHDIINICEHNCFKITTNNNI
jgi:hypothetical protein